MEAPQQKDRLLGVYKWLWNLEILNRVNPIQ